MATENFALNSLIIPMEEAFQNNGMWLAYGLAYRLLSNGIPVKWAIRPGKAYDAFDFTASAQDLQNPAVTTSNYPYKGGPFIIDSSQYAAALPIITAWQAANPNTKVHRATSAFTAPIAFTLSRRPVIAVEETNSGIIIGYLNAAKIPDSNGNPWPNSSPDILSPDEIGAGAFYATPPGDPCRYLKYDIFLSPHTSDGTWTDPVNAAELDTFVRIGGFIHATCHSISAIENFAGPFLTTSGFTSFGNKGDSGTFTVDEPDYPSAQAVPTSGKVQVLPGGSEQTWLHSSVTYLPSTQVLAHFLDNGTQYDFMVGGSYKGGTGAGKVVYEGGHQYAVSLPYSNNAEGPYLRFLYDSIFFAVGKPRIRLAASPVNVPSGSATAVTYTVFNDGGAPANGLTLSVTLPPFAVYNPGSATIPPTSIIGQTLTWNAAALAGNTGPGTVLTFTAQVTPPGTGFQSAASYTANWGDDHNEAYNFTYCASVNAQPGASPSIAKTPSPQTANPNSPVSWTITASNNGTLALNNVVITDTLPAGLTFVSAVPTPTSVVPGMGGTTIITWQSPQIPASIPPGGSIVITLNVLTPPATTAVFTNEVTLTGNDTTPASYAVSTTATLNVNDRPPTATVISPNGGELVCTGTDITWTASDPDGDPLTYSLYYSSDGGANYNLIIAGLAGVCPPPGPPNCTYFWDTSGLPSGSNYLVKVVASDGLLTGEDTSNAPFTIDNTPPTVSWVFPTNGANLNTTPVVLEASATDNIGVTNVLFQYSTDGGITWTDIGSDNVPVGTVYSTNWELTGLPSGTYQLRAVATDTCGRTAQSVITVTQSLPPTITVIFPNGGEILCPPSTTITWTASDPNGDPLTYSVLYSSNGGATYTVLATGLTGTCPAPGPPVCSYVWNTAALPSGNNYVIKVVASDGITTAEDTSDAPFTIDNTPPTLNFTSPVSGSFVTGTVTVSATATDNVGVTGVTFEYSNDGGATYNLIANVTTPFDSTYATPWVTNALPNGPYLLRATARDQCNNTSRQVINVTVDNTPPAVSITNPPNGSEVFGVVQLRIEGHNSECLSKVDVYIDGVLVYTQIVTGGAKDTVFFVDWNTNDYTEGPHQVRAVATDCAGLTAETTNTYIINNLPDHFTQLLIDGELELPPEKPDIAQIVDFEVNSRVTNIDSFSTVDGTKLLVKGFVDIGVTYVATGPLQTEHFAHFSKYFVGTILWPGLPLSAKVCPVLFVEHEQHHITGPRTIKKDIVLFVGVRLP